MKYMKTIFKKIIFFNYYLSFSNYTLRPSQTQNMQRFDKSNQNQNQKKNQNQKRQKKHISNMFSLVLFQIANIENC